MPTETDFPHDLKALEPDYELIREIGQGGMAAVYLARRRDTGALVAIKAIRARYLDDPEALRRFAREARTVAELDHPNIVRTLEIEQIGDRAVAIIMEHISGGTVRDRLREHGTFGAEQAESVLRDVANALGYAHRRGIVHRDVKPENVFVDERRGRALLSDFGIARRIEGDAPITLLGAALGTPQYMSPEQIDGRSVDGRSDIYSLGVLGWELLTGRRPWAGENLYGVIYKQKHEELPRITSLRPRVPANLLFAIEGALVKDKERRWQSTEEFLEQLTYNPPPVLAQSYPSATVPVDNEPTVRFRSATAHEAVPRDEAPVPRPASASPSAVAAEPLPPNGRERGAVDSVPPRRTTTARVPTGRHESGAPSGLWRKPMVRGLALLVPLAIAGTALYVVLGGSPDSPGREDSGTLTTSGGAVALDSGRPIDTTPRPPVGPVKATSPPPDSRPTPPERARRDSAPAPAAPSKAAPTPTVGASSVPKGVPSPRCGVASIADQRACLLAYIADIDAPLQRVYDSLISELRRAGGAARGEPDPPAAASLRAEQRTWIATRDRECTRRIRPGSVPLWAQPLSECFAEVSAVRADELTERLRRFRRQ